MEPLEIVGLKAIAKSIPLPKERVRRLIKSGDLPVYTDPDDGRETYRIGVRELERWVDSRGAKYQKRQ